MKIGLVIIALLLLLGGGGYWYVEVYQPRQYAKAVLALEDELKAYGAQMSQPQFRWRYDYETAINALDRYDAFFAQWLKKIEALKPPMFNQELKEFHVDLLIIGTEFPKGADRARKTIAFVKNAIEIDRIYNPESTTIRETLPPELRSNQPPLPMSQPYDLGTAIDYFKSRLAAAKPYADAMFNQEPIDLGGNTFAELKSLWEEMNQAVNTVLPALEQKYGRNKPLGSLPSPSELEKTIPGAAFFGRGMDEFERKLESIIIRGGAQEILQSSLYPQSGDFQQRSQSVGESLKKLREQYGK